MTLQELLDAIADAAGVTPADIKLLKRDYDTGSVRIEIDGIDLNPDEEAEEEDDDTDLDESDDE